jgi:hypothetical protein
MNPFSPTFGTSPRVVVGREQIVQRIAQALDNPFDPARKTLFVASRGCGKTVLLNEAQMVARQRGWFVIQEDARRGLMGRIHGQINDIIRSISPPPRRKLTSVQASGFGAAWENSGDQPQSLRTELRELAGRADGGVMITIDEIHEVDRAELAALANDIQHLDRESVPIAVFFAGLPSAADEEDPRRITFLARSWRPEVELTTTVRSVRVWNAPPRWRVGYSMLRRWMSPRR